MFFFFFRKCFFLRNQIRRKRRTSIEYETLEFYLLAHKMTRYTILLIFFKFKNNHGPEGEYYNKQTCIEWTEIEHLIKIKYAMITDSIKFVHGNEWNTTFNLKKIVIHMVRNLETSLLWPMWLRPLRVGRY